MCVRNFSSTKISLHVLPSQCQPTRHQQWPTVGQLPPADAVWLIPIQMSKVLQFSRKLGQFLGVEHHKVIKNLVLGVENGFFLMRGKQRKDLSDHLLAPCQWDQVGMGANQLLSSRPITVSK